MMTGDVAGAFRHVPFNCWFCGYFSGYIPELDLIVVNLCLPFGWTGSPVHYSIAGQAIKAIHNSRPGLQNLVYCDDHILIGNDRRLETQVSGIALRRAMVTVLVRPPATKRSSLHGSGSAGHSGSSSISIRRRCPCQRQRSPRSWCVCWPS
jgi:hypothetical protein